MGILVSKVFASLFGSKEVRILILGLDNAGKTTILYRLQADEIEQTVPTIGFNMETLQYKNVKFQVWDLGGQTSIRPYWRCYYPNTDAIIFTVDSADIDRLNIAKQELHAMLEEEELKDSILLVFANKQDQKGALNAAQISEAMGLSEIRNRQWSIKETTATSGAGLFEGFDWIIRRHKQQSMLYDDPASVWDGPVDQWPADHCRVLHCIAQYARQAKNVHTQESWVRQIALLVLLNEGIECGVLKFDYAPNLTWLSYQRQTERRWLCISQEAKSVIDDLWEARLVNGLKLSSIDYQPVTAFQASTRGLVIAEQIPQQYKDDGDRIIYPPPPHLRILLRVHYDGVEFVVQADDYVKTSNITQVEDVSYVSSPYLPSCIRSSSGFRVNPTCNKLRATESARGHSMMAKDAKESIVLSSVRALVGEWMPFGANQIAALNDRLGAMDRCQGGLFSSKIDDKPTETHFDTPSELTQVKILDFDSINFINFEAEITSEEAEGVIQVENFGMHLNVSGALLYGVKIEAIMNRTEREIPLDLLARLVVDIHEDSSDIITNLLSRYQLSVLDMLFMNKAKQRNKYNLLMASGITPKLAASKYLDKGDRENELKQVLGEIYACYDITREDVLFLGREGCLLAGPNADRYESLLTTFIGLNSRELFIRNFFVRTFVLDDTLKNLRRLIRNYRRYPGCLPSVKATLSEAARNIILLVECLQYLLESVEDMELPAIPMDAAGSKIFKSLSLMERKNSILIRCKDSIKLIERLRTQLDTLIMKFETITRVQLADASREFDLNITPMLDTLHTRRRVRSSMDVIRVILAGNLSFEVVDRLSGGTFNVDPPKWFMDWIKKPLVGTPLVYFTLNMLWFALVWHVLQWWITRNSRRLEALVVVQALVDKRINVTALHDMIHKKAVRMQTVECTITSPERQMYMWTEARFPTADAETQVELLVDERQQLLRSIRLQVFCPIGDSKPLQKQRRKNFASMSLRRLYPTPSSTGLTENSLLEQFTNVLRKRGVYVEAKTPLARLGSIKHLHRVKVEHGDRDMRSRRQRLSQGFNPTLL